MLDKAVDAVAEFMTAKNINFHQRLTEVSKRNDCPQLIYLMKAQAEACLKTFTAQSDETKDYRLLSLHLVLEETAEWVEAILEGDEEKTLDAAADCLYVHIGSCVRMELPLSAAFEEVHRSNMTKASRGTHINSNSRLRDKGEAWTPPRINEIISAHRLDSKYGAALVNMAKPTGVADSMTALIELEQAMNSVNEPRATSVPVDMNTTHERKNNACNDRGT